MSYGNGKSLRISRVFRDKQVRHKQGRNAMKYRGGISLRHKWGFRDKQIKYKSEFL